MPPHRLRAAEVDEVAGGLDAADGSVEGAIGREGVGGAAPVFGRRYNYGNRIGPSYYL
jgi:hypothetical protein